jgi:hypothetical protein
MKYIITILFLTIFQITQACDCLWHGSFMEVAKNSETVF